MNTKASYLLVFLRKPPSLGFSFGGPADPLVREAGLEREGSTGGKPPTNLVETIKAAIPSFGHPTSDSALFKTPSPAVTSMDTGKHMERDASWSQSREEFKVEEDQEDKRGQAVRKVSADGMTCKALNKVERLA